MKSAENELEMFFGILQLQRKDREKYERKLAVFFKKHDKTGKVKSSKDDRKTGLLA